jgi:hypothetical protein
MFSKIQYLAYLSVNLVYGYGRFSYNIWSYEECLDLFQPSFASEFSMNSQYFEFDNKIHQLWSYIAYHLKLCTWLMLYSPSGWPHLRSRRFDRLQMLKFLCRNFSFLIQRFNLFFYFTRLVNFPKMSVSSGAVRSFCYQTFASF